LANQKAVFLWVPEALRIPRKPSQAPSALGSFSGLDTPKT